jgi:hypothetical protein
MKESVIEGVNLGIILLMTLCLGTVLFIGEREGDLSFINKKINKDERECEEI